MQIGQSQHWLLTWSRVYACDPWLIVIRDDHPQLRGHRFGSVQSQLVIEQQVRVVVQRPARKVNLMKEYQRVVRPLHCQTAKLSIY